MVSGQVYKTESTEEPIYKSWLKNANERDILEDLLRQRFTDWCYTQPLSIIEWGCGLGSAAQRFISVLEERKADFNYRGIDPFPDQLKRFRTAVPNNPNIELQEGGFETYQPERIFDLGMAIHSLYYAKNIPRTIKKISDYARRMFLVHHGFRGIHQIHETFPELVLQDASEISTHENICIALERLGIHYDLRVYETETKIEVCHDSNNLEGRNMIKFFLDNPNLSQREIEKVRDYLRSLGSIMKHDMALIITE